MQRITEADLLDRFRQEYMGTCDSCLPPGGSWSDKDEGKPVGRVYLGKTLLQAGRSSQEALRRLLWELTGSSSRVKELCFSETKAQRGLFVDATYKLGDKVWLFEVKTSLRGREALTVGAQLWLYRWIYKWEHPHQKVAAWIITTKFEGHSLYRHVFLDLYVNKLSLALFLLDERIIMGPKDCFI